MDRERRARLATGTSKKLEVSPSSQAPVGPERRCLPNLAATCPPYVCQMTVMCPALVRRLVSQPPMDRDPSIPQRRTAGRWCGSTTSGGHGKRRKPTRRHAVCGDRGGIWGFAFGNLVPTCPAPVLTEAIPENRMGNLEVRLLPLSGEMPITH
jgi:hypothetical protein